MYHLTLCPVSNTCSQASNEEPYVQHANAAAPAYLSGYPTYSSSSSGFYTADPLLSAPSSSAASTAAAAMQHHPSMDYSAYHTTGHASSVPMYSAAAVAAGGGYADSPAGNGTDTSKSQGINLYRRGILYNNVQGGSYMQAC